MDSKNAEKEMAKQKFRYKGIMPFNSKKFLT